MKPKCTGHKSNGEPCGNWPIHGATVCRSHGGAAPHVKAAAAQRVAEDKARALVATYGVPVETTATDALLKEVQWTAGHVEWLRERVRELEAEQLVWGKTQSKTGGQDWGETEAAVPNVWLKLYNDERAHLVRVCSEAIRAGIEERRVRLAEQQGELVAQVIRRILGDLDLTDEQQARVPDVAARHLRALAG